MENILLPIAAGSILVLLVGLLVDRLDHILKAQRKQALRVPVKIERVQQRRRRDNGR